MREYEEKLKASGPDKKQPPPEPSVDFSKSIAIYRKLLSQFPNYPLNDASYYLLGYCLEKQNQIEEGQQAYHQLIARYPKSKFTTEAWVRIGEYRFEIYNTPQMLTKAAEAYEAAVKATGHLLYDKAMYKLGWTYYRMDRFEDAVSRFTALLDHYEQKGGAKPEEGGDLRTEALQYTALSFADEKWGSLEKAKAFFQKLGGRRYEAEIYKPLGEVYFDQTKPPEGIQAYRLALPQDPLSICAPHIQQPV